MYMVPSIWIETSLVPASGSWTEGVEEAGDPATGERLVHEPGWGTCGPVYGCPCALAAGVVLAAGEVLAAALVAGAVALAGAGGVICGGCSCVLAGELELAGV